MTDKSTGSKSGCKITSECFYEDIQKLKDIEFHGEPVNFQVDESDLTIFQNSQSKHESLEMSREPSACNNNCEYDVTPESFQVPKEIENLKIKEQHQQDILLPKNSNNASILPKSTFKNCTFLEGTTTIPKNIQSFLFSNGKLNSKFYPYILRTKIGKKINNICSNAI